MDYHECSEGEVVREKFLSFMSVFHKSFMEPLWIWFLITLSLIFTMKICFFFISFKCQKIFDLVFFIQSVLLIALKRVHLNLVHISSDPRSLSRKTATIPLMFLEPFYNGIVRLSCPLWLH